MPQERKVVTVLFADIVDSSATTRSYDAEVLRAALARMFARTREILVAHGATVEKFIGDAVMAVFGVPVAHEDDAERAVRAALALRADVSPNREDGRPGFTLRIGINTGEVVTGDGEGAEFLVTGEPVIVAARLEQMAGHGEILVGPLTREITRGRVSYGPVRTIQTKGMGRIEVATAEGLAEPRGTTGQTASPFVGRESEMRLLDDVHRRVASTGRPHLVTVYGDAGVGKTRVALEFLRRLDPAEPIARAACLPYGHAITYWPLQELIRGEAAITPTDGRDAARAKIETRVAGMEGLDELEAKAIARELAALALADADTPQSELTSDARRRELALGMTRYLEARLGSTPGTIVLEDLHWAEEPFLALLEELLEHLHAPLLLLCLARPDLLERRPSWGSGRTNAMAIALEPLDVRETERLVRALLSDGGSDRPVDEIVERTEGNPLFVEEYVHMLVDQGSRAVVPPTLHGVIAARIDATTPGVKRLLHEASVLGRDFWLDALPTAPAGADVAEAERRGLISRRARRGPSGSPTFVFRHGLIRDVAYSSLSKAERTRVHDHYSRWLETAAGERAQEYAEIVAYHAERAFALAHELDAAGAADLGRRAFTLLSRSAAGASARGEFRASRELNDRALGIGGSDVPPAELASARALGAIVKLRLDSDFAAVNELDLAIDAARSLGPSAELVRLLVWRASSVTILDDIAESERQFEEAIAVARETGDREILAYAVWTSSEPLGLTGRLDEQAKLLEHALAEIRAVAAPYEVACLDEICVNAAARGDHARAREVADEAIAAARATGRRMDRWRAAYALSISLLASGDPGAHAAAEEALILAREIGGPGALAEAARTASLARQASGDLEGARTVLDETFAQLDPTRMTIQRDAITRLETRRAEVALARGDIETARTSATTAVRIAPKPHVETRAAALLALASVALVEERHANARSLITEAMALLAPSGYRDLRERAERMAEGLSTRSQAR
ncbi:MAG: AAA family ATPase [Chloroflexota bacterium]|nr:AAA family ATPase [Chloroflexota bacterium]